MSEKETKDSFLISKAIWNKNASPQNDVAPEPREHIHGNHSAVSLPGKIDQHLATLIPKVRPFDPAFFLANSKPKKQIGMTNYLHTGEMLKYLDALMETLPETTKQQLVSSFHQLQGQAPDSSSNSYTAVDTLTYAEVARHLTTLRTEHVQRFIRPVLQRLLLHPRNVGNLFNKPVDPVLLELPDYFIRIKRPMDLGTVKSRLQRGFYRSIESVTSDINLVFKNAISYNASNHDINLIAKIMRTDFEVDMLSLEEKCARETDRKSTHSCTLCQEASCPLCGEKCLKFDPPVLVCHGTCLQKVKKNSVYYVTVDGIMLWCQRCYTGLPTVILELPSRPPLLKRNLLKRRLDEEVAEPWVSCDICGHWFHQICALYNDRMSISADCGSSGSGGGVALSGGSSTSTNPRGHYECPLCKLESMQQKCAKQTYFCDGNKCLSGRQHALDPDVQPCVAERKMRSHPGTICGLDEKLCVSELVGGARERDRVLASNKVRVEKSLRRSSASIPARAETRSRAGASKVASTASSQPKTQELSTAPTTLDAVGAHSASPVMPKSLTPRAVCTGDQETGGLNGHGGFDNIDVLSSSHSSATTASLMSSVNVAEREVEEVMDVSDDSSVTTATICSDIAPCISPTIPGKRDREDPGNRTIQDNILPAHLNQWRASTLPRSHLSDFLEALVAERLRSSGYEEAADTVTVRMTSNVEQYMEVPATIVDNLRTSEGLCIPPYLAYKQKCILMFQKVDGVDICLFCLYVQEFDEKCPEPNKSVVYIAYLDSVDFFRPMEARTLVYQEVMVGYFKWVQMRGFKQGHIWSCPPQRGDNFIFWCHPPHQRTPSRDRLNAWYNSILLRCSKLGILEEVGTLWSACFSGYGRRESSGRKDRLVDDLKNTSSVAELEMLKEAIPPSPRVSEASQTAFSGSSSSSSSSNRSGKADSTTSAGGEPEDAPVCPPVFEGDYWVTECLRVHRLMMGRSKGCDGQDRGVNQRKCRDLLKDLMSRPSSTPFSRPVDIVKLGIPDYPTVVTQPMDLGTVRDQLRLRYYKSILHFAEDVRLTFRNALKFNPDGHPINSTARLLLLDFESCLVDLLSEYVGAIPKAENVDKYLDSYPIADLIPPVAVPFVDPGLDDQEKATIVGSKIPPLELPPTECSVPRGRGRRKIARGRQSGSGSRGAITSLEGVPEDGDGTVGNHIPVYGDDTDQMATPQLRRADSMDSIQSCNSIANENCSNGDDNDNWTPRLLFAPVAISGPIPRPATQGVEAERKAFEKPCLGFKGAMALMSEISKSVFRLKDDLFVIKFTPPLRSKEKSLKKRTVSAQSLCDELDNGLAIPVSNPSPYHLEAKEGDLETEVISSCSNPTEQIKGVYFSEPMSVSDVYSRVSDGAELGVRNAEEGADLKATMEVNAEKTNPDAADAMCVPVDLNLRLMRADDEGMEMSEGGSSTTLTELFVSLTQDQDAPLQSIPLDTSYWAADNPLDPADAYPSNPPLVVISNVSYDQNAGDEVAVASLSDVVSPPVLPPIPPPKRGRRGREPGTGRSSHQKKSKGARGRNRAKADVPVSIISAVSGGVTANQQPATDISVPAAIAIKTKGGKAGAYLRRLGERDQREEGEGDCEEEFSPYCLSLLADLVPDTTDPDHSVKCPFVDSRHTFLEMCQFRHYQFDSLRRAKHSSLMLLYHLHYPNNVNARPTCACCKGAIRDVRWHCDQCADFDVCDSCYQAAESETKLDPVDCNLIPLLSKKDKDGNIKREQVSSSAPAPDARLDKHSHPLTPFRITYI